MDWKSSPMNPCNKESAEQVLKLFHNKAHNISYQNAFTSAVAILYGPTFIIKRDACKRMFFKCTVCNKEMNSTTSLVQHVRSGSHIKNVDLYQQERVGPVAPLPRTEVQNLKFDCNILRILINKSTLPILGLQRVEHFWDGIRSYYKCCLCMVHSNCEAMLKHLVGEKHTDKYIQSKIVLKKPIITAEERAQLRTVIYNKENYSAESMITIYGKNYFPYFLENNRKKRHRSLGEPSTFKETRFCDMQLPKIEAQVTKMDVGTQTEYSRERYEDILHKFAFIIKTDHLNQTKLASADDLRMTLIIMVFAFHWLFFTNESFLLDKVNVSHHKNQKVLIEGCLGHVIKKLGHAFRCKFPHLQLELD